MSDTENRDVDQTVAETEGASSEEQQERLNLEVQVDTRGACERHITVTIPHDDIDRYYDKEFSEMMPTAQIPGFRPGRAPRKLVETRYRKDLGDKVKTQLLLDSLAQIHEDQKLAAIGEPDLDLDKVDIPKDGPLTFEFNLEVRPEFAIPQWKGLKVEKPVKEITATDVDETLKRLLENRGKLIPFDGAAAPGDYISVNLTFKDGDTVLSSASEEVIRIRPTLSFRDGKIEKFDKLLSGVKAGETRTGEAEVSADAPNEILRGKKLTAQFEVLEVKKLETPEITPELLQEMGGFESEADLRDAIKDQLGRQLDYEQHRRAREQVTAALLESATWELPQKLLQNQSHRELQRSILELQRSGFGENDIRAHANEIRQNSFANTAKSLKEHFILEAIAEEEKIDADEADYDAEINLIAYQSNESPRRIRARLEKSGNMDVLRNQIVERKVVKMILDSAEFKETPFEFEKTEIEALDQALGGVEHEEAVESKEESSAE